jgi:hypothetical protein
MAVREAEVRLFAASDHFQRLGLSNWADNVDMATNALTAALDAKDAEITRLRAALAAKDPASA